MVVYINTYADSIQNRHWRNSQDVFTDGSSNALVMERFTDGSVECVGNGAVFSER